MGAVAIFIEAEDDSYKWAYLVDPGAQEWWVERFSPQSGDFFVWVEPRSYVDMDLGTLRSVEVRVESAKPVLLVNGRGVAASAGVRLEHVPGSVLFGFGASGAGFSVEYDGVEVSEV
jgi:hypothetical protein